MFSIESCNLEVYIEIVRARE